MKKVILSNKKNIYAAILGNICEHYDNALFALLVPFIAKFFFPNSSNLNALIYTYGILVIGIVTRPLGALIFGYIGDKFGRVKSLFCTILGMSLTSVCYVFIPMSKSYSFIFLILLKGMQSFFASGETPGGAIFVLENSNKKSLLSSLYDASSILGILIASLAINLFAYLNIVEKYWKVLFLIGALPAFIAFFIRFKTYENIPSPNKQKIFTALWSNKSAFIYIFFICGFYYFIYDFSVTFLNGFLPLVSNISKQAAISINSLLLLLDFFLLPIFGFFAQKFSKEKMMLTSSLLAAIIPYFLFSILKQANIQTALSVRFIFVMIGIWFSAPMHHMIQEIAPKKHISLFVSLGMSLGSVIFGKPSSALSLFLYKKTNSIFAPGILLSTIGLCAFFAIYKNIKIFQKDS